MKELHKDKLSQLANDDIMLVALSQLLINKIEDSKPRIENENNEHIGEKYRAYIEAKSIFDGLINDIKSYKRGNKPQKATNRAR